METLVYNTHSLRGLGTNIGLLSRLNHTGKQFQIQVTKTWIEYLHIFKDMFNIENLNIVCDNDIINTADSYFYKFSDTDKFFAPYITSDVINYKGGKYDVSPHNPTRKYIGIACYGNIEPHEVFDRNYQSYNLLPYPKNKQYPIEDYAAIFSLAKKAGYDVMTFDNPNMSIGEKIYLMNQYCDCVIGYEGGLAHLAHTLKVPYVMLPWHRFIRGNIPLPDEINHKGEEKFPFDDARLTYAYALHLDEKTYFAKNINEVLSWTPDKLHEIINMLKNDNGNNIYTSNSKFFINREATKYKLDYMGNDSIWWNLDKVSSPHATEFCIEHYPNLQVAGKFAVNWIEE